MRDERAILRVFYKKLHRVMDNGMEPVYKLLKGIYIVFMTFGLALPYEEGRFLVLMPQIMAITFFNMRYFTIAEDGKQQNLAAKLRYLPVSRRALWRVRMEVLCRFLSLPFLLGLPAHLIASYVTSGRITAWDVCYPVSAAFLLPFLVGVLACAADK